MLLLGLSKLVSCLPLLSFIIMLPPVHKNWSILFLKRMNVHNTNYKWTNKHEQIYFEGVDEELCLIVSLLV